jgi:hypothetical protein
MFAPAYMAENDEAQPHGIPKTVFDRKTIYRTPLSLTGNPEVAEGPQPLPERDFRQRAVERPAVSASGGNDGRSGSASATICCYISSLSTPFCKPRACRAQSVLTSPNERISRSGKQS